MQLDVLSDSFDFELRREPNKKCFALDFVSCAILRGEWSNQDQGFFVDEVELHHSSAAFSTKNRSYLRHTLLPIDWKSPSCIYKCDDSLTVLHVLVHNREIESEVKKYLYFAHRQRI